MKHSVQIFSLSRFIRGMCASALILLGSQAYAQTFIVNPTTDGGFETGNNFGSNGWTAINTSGSYGWFCGAPGASLGTNGAYISNNSGSSATFQTVMTSHIYKDVVIPAGATNISLSFKWRCGGDGYIYARAYLAPTSFVPTASSSYQSNWPNVADAVSDALSFQPTVWQTVTTPISNSLAGTTRRLIISFSTDGYTFGVDFTGAQIDEVSLTACVPPGTPTITQGASVSRCAGAPATTLSVTGNQGSAANWSWYTGSCGGTLVGTGASISVSPTTTTTYYVRGDGGCPPAGACASVVVNVNQPVTINNQPATPIDLCTGANLNLGVVASNASGYTWYLGPSPVPNGGPVTGANSSNMQITGVAPGFSGSYHVVIAGNGVCPSVTSNSSVVTINDPITISTQPSTSETLCEGNPLTLTAVASNVGSYQWYGPSGALVNGGSISGATSASLSITPTVLADAGIYYLLINPLPGCAPQNTPSSSVVINAPVNVTTSLPPATGVCDGTDINLAVTATNATSYTWEKDGFTLTDGGDISGATTANLVVATSDPSDAGVYTLTLGATSPCPSVAISTTVTNDHPAAITTQPFNPNACHGTGTNLAVVATGANLTYQWFEGASPLTNAAPYSGVNAATLNISSVNGLDNNNYSVTITGSCGSAVTSDVVNFTENFNNTWTGNVNNYWSNSSNWACGVVPTSVTNAVVPDVPNLPIVDVPSAVCKDLLIDPLASVTFNGTNNKLAVHGNIVNNGTLNGTGGVGATIELAGSTAQTTAGALVLENLTISGGGVKTLGSTTGVAGILNLDNGMLELGNYDLVLAQPTAQLGGSPSSFIVTNGTGEVVGENIGAIGGNPAPARFHVGPTAASYNPIELENLGTADGFRVRVIENVYKIGDDITSAQVTNPVVERTWMVSENTVGGSFVTMTPMWNSPTDETGDFDDTRVYVAHYWNNMWTSYIDSAFYAPAAVAGPFANMLQTTEDSIENFSPFTVASFAQVPLAIKLNSIVAMNAGARNKVEWKSATEDAGDVYELESSADGRKFTKIATIAANGKASAYTQWDEQPVQGINYYRVKMLDRDGKYSYSKVVTATVNGKDGFSVEVYPNPVGNTVSVKVDGAVTGKGSVVVTDITGKVVSQKVSVEENTATINVSNLSSGIYMLNYSDDVRSESVKITKQ